MHRAAFRCHVRKRTSRSGLAGPGTSRRRQGLRYSPRRCRVQYISASGGSGVEEAHNDMEGRRRRLSLSSRRGVSMVLCKLGVAPPASIRLLFAYQMVSEVPFLSKDARLERSSQLLVWNAYLSCKAIEARASTTTTLAPSYRELLGMARRLPPVSSGRPCKVVFNVGLWFLAILWWLLSGRQEMCADWPIPIPVPVPSSPSPSTAHGQLARPISKYIKCCHETCRFLVGEWLTTHAREWSGIGTRGLRWALVYFVTDVQPMP